MSMIDAIPLLAGAGADGYQISRSVRLRSSASAYLSRTFGTPTSNTTWTYSVWVKRSRTGANETLLTRASDVATMYFESGTDQLVFWTNTQTESYYRTSRRFRDPSAWMHIVWIYNTTNATQADRSQLWINGVRETAFATSSPQPGLNATSGGMNASVSHTIGGPSNLLDGYLTEINFIDGQALTPSNFGEIDAITGVWKPKRYTGTYGNNGFYLNFSDNSGVTATTIGKDYSGNGNNWTPSAGISITAGTTYDSMIDVPTLYDDGDKGRGNYATFNPLAKGTLFPAPTEGNLRVADTAIGNYHQSIGSTIAVNTGKWYWEIPVNGATFNSRSLGIAFASQLAFSTSNQNAMWNTTTDLKDYRAIFMINSTTMTPCRSIAGTVTTATNITLPSTLTGSSIFMVAMDIGAGAIWFGLNGVWLKGATTAEIIAGTTTNAVYTDIGSPSDSWTPAVYSYLGAAGYGWFANFGQRPFTYTPPTGFKALNTQNLPTPTISNGATVMAATTYTGNGGTQTITNTVNNISFQPDLVWVKVRSSAATHGLIDSVRGAGIALASNLTDAERNNGTGAGGDVIAFNSNGFNLGNNTTGSATNSNLSGSTYVGWQWNAGGSTVTNTSGTISAQVRANATAGFSVVTYTGTGANATVGHGLGVAPSMVIVKNRTSGTTDVWCVYHSSLGNTQLIILNRTDATTTSSTVWNNTSPTSSVFSIGTLGDVNRSTNTYVAYCFAAVAGYSAFGKYTGNGSTDGSFVFCGFRPRWVMIKNSSSAGNHWIIIDTARDTYNLSIYKLGANTSAVENDAATVGTSANNMVDILSNGFKLRSTNGDTNGSGTTYIFAAFAENPFKNSLAR